MPLAFRVEKRKPTDKATARRGRGRPSDWSPALQKRLIALRLCGLQLTEIIKVLNILSNGTFRAKERRAQQILRENLCNGYSRYCAANKATTRKRAAFLRASKRYNRTSSTLRRHARSDSRYEENAPRSAVSQTSATKQFTTKATSILTSTAPDTLQTILHSYVAGTQSLVMSRDGRSTLHGKSPRSELVNNIPKSPRESRVALQTIQEYDDSDISMTDESRSMLSDRRTKVRDILKTASYSSSVISDIQSMLDRFSLSTLATSSRGSASIASIRNGDGYQRPSPFGSTDSVPAAVLERHSRRIQQANTALIEMCCSQNPDCIHRDIRAATISNLSDGSFRMDDVLSGTHVFGKGDDCTLKDLQNDQKLQEINASDVYGNNTLFFAARSGASLDVLLALLGRTFNVNAVNSDGQTFLFLLDPHDASFSKCNCAASLAGYHSSGFECLIRKLEERTFNFDQIDHDGKNFLFCLCAAHTFNPDWLDRLVEHDRTWLGRIQSLAQVRDSSGSYLKDFLALNLKTSDVIETRWLELDSYKNSRLSTFLCSEEFLLGSTSLHEQVIRDVSNVMIPYSISTMVNQYNRFGRTPIMEFLEMALDRGIKETLVVAKLQELESLGAKINTRNRDGDTMLHIAAKRSCPEILEHLLFVGVQVDHRNNTGLTALDYAAQNVDRSRHIKVSPHAMASSFKSATRLLDYARLGFGRQKSSDKIAQKNLKAAEEAAKRSLESMTKLQNYRRPLTADRNPSL